MAGSFFAVVFPTACSLCHQELTEAGTIDICSRCWASFEPWVGTCCAQCGLPIPSGLAEDSARPICPQCRDKEFEFDFARSYGLYGGQLRAAILQLKFRRRERLGKKLGELLASRWKLFEAPNASPPMVVPVPLHSARQCERGFNQAELLARGLCAKLARSREGKNLRVETGCVKRSRATASQTGLNFEERRENVRGVFAVTRPERVRGREVVLVDDVMTTGATLSACAGALKQAGALRVSALTLARATPQFPDPDLAELAQAIDEFERE
jgi:ComF family protein